MEEPAVASASIPLGIRSAPPAICAGWLLFNSSGVKEEEAANSNGMIEGTTSNDRDVRFSLRLVAPPACSCLQVHTDAELFDGPTVLNADGDLLLIHMIVVVPELLPTSYYEHNFFVYKPHPVSSSLQLLPQFDEWTAQARFTGIACRGEQFVVAAFHTNILTGRGNCGPNNREQVGKLIRFSSSKDKWDVKDLPIPFDPEKGLHKFIWETDKVFSFCEFMCWVDYHRGILYCDVFADLPELRFVQLPGIEIWGPSHNFSDGRQFPQAYRTVSVSKGLVKFVDVDDGLFGTKKTSGFTVTTWTLRMLELEWEKDGVLLVDHLWSRLDSQHSHLPHWAPEFPVVSKHDPDILHFILRGPEFTAKAWMISVNMRKKALQSYMPYTNPAGKVYDYGEGETFDTRSTFSDTPLICSDMQWPNMPTGGDCETVVIMSKKPGQADVKQRAPGSSSPNAGPNKATQGKRRKQLTNKKNKSRVKHFRELAVLVERISMLVERISMGGHEAPPQE